METKMKRARKKNLGARAFVLGEVVRGRRDMAFSDNDSLEIQSI